VEVAPPPPEERYQSSFPEPLGAFFEVTQPDADRYIVRGVHEQVLPRARRAGPEIEIRALPPPYLDLRFALRFALRPEDFRTAGPMSVEVKLDGEPLVAGSFEGAGEHSLEQWLPREKVRWDGENAINIKIRRADGTGRDAIILLISAGFDF
jgi:hypothetical protein